MSRRPLTFAIGDYDRTRPLIDGSVMIDGVDPNFLLLSPEEIFFRALRNAEFHVCELSLSSYVLNVSRSQSAYVGIPVYPSRAFRHTAFYVRNDSPLRTLSSLAGKKVGIPEYQLTALVWARAMLEGSGRQAERDRMDPGRHRGGVAGGKGLAFATRGIRLMRAPQGHSLTSYLAEGGIDAILAPRPPSSFGNGGGTRWLLDDPVREARGVLRAVADLSDHACDRDPQGRPRT